MASAKRKSKIASNSRDGTTEEEKMERQKEVGMELCCGERKKETLTFKKIYEI